MPALATAVQPDAPSTPMIEAWVRYIRAMEDAYQPPMRLSPAEAQTAAVWAARLGQEPPAAPAPQPEAVLTR